MSASDLQLMLEESANSSTTVFDRVPRYLREGLIFPYEGGVKFVPIAFAFIPGQFGALEGVHALLAAAIGLPAAVGLTLALVRRMRGLLVAAVGVVVLAFSSDR